MWGFFEKSLDYFAKCGDFGGENRWGQVEIFDRRSGDSQPEPSGNTANVTKTTKLKTSKGKN